jgi:cell division protein FtsA
MKSIPSLVRGQGRLMASLAPQVIASVDIGSVKTACLIAEWNPGKKAADGDVRPGLKILGHGQTVSRGVKSGAIADIAEAEKSIRVAVDAAERMARTTIRAVYVNVSGGRNLTAMATAAVKTQTGVVGQGDIDTVISQAIASADIGKRHVLHLLPACYGIDGVESAQAPIGMHGEVLSAGIAVVTMDPAPLHNLRMAVERSHLGLEGVSLTAYAAAKSVLAADEMDLGTIVLDMGGCTTNIAIFRHGKLVASATVPLGGQHITNDIAHGLQTTVVHAERLKTMFGSVLGNGHDEREMLAVPLLGERGVDTVQKVPKHVLTSIIVPRVDELLQHVHHTLIEGPLAGHLSNRIVVTGGASQLHGMREFASARLGLPVRLGSPMQFQNMPDQVRSSTYATCAGLLVAATEPQATCDMPQEARMAIDRSQMTYARRVGKWLAEAF